MRHGRLVLLILALLALAPAGAAAATLAPLKPCYVTVTAATADREQVVVQGSGFTPGALLDVSIRGEVVGSATADGTGAMGPFGVPAPYQKRGVGFFDVTVTERDNPGVSVQGRALVAALSTRITPQPRRFDQRVTWSGYGWTLDKPVYAHYLRKGKVRRTYKLGRPTGECGRLSVKRRYVPFRPKRGQVWEVWLEQYKKFNRKPRFFTRFQFKVG